jgi:hypothetical protein
VEPLSIKERPKVCHVVVNDLAMETSNTSGFAGYALQVICGQEWVRERCLQDPQILFSPELLLDPELTINQVCKLCLKDEYSLI